MENLKEKLEQRKTKDILTVARNVQQQILSELQHQMLLTNTSLDILHLYLHRDQKTLGPDDKVIRLKYGSKLKVYSR